MRGEKIVLKSLQRYWRMTRGLTLGVQGAIIDDRSRLLLVRHGYRPGWHFPGGGVEKNETLLTALGRELEEEAGVVCDTTPALFGVYANFAAFPNDHVALFVVRDWRQPRIPPPNAEIREQRFFARDELPDDIAPPTLRRIAEILDGAPQTAEW